MFAAVCVYMDFKAGAQKQAETSVKINEIFRPMGLRFPFQKR